MTERHYRCPCGGTYTAGYLKADGVSITHGEFLQEYDGVSPPVVLHSDPGCPAFIEMECVEFLRYARGVN